MLIKQNYTAQCLRAIDGDTILIFVQCPTCGDGKQMRLRLARIDAPEKVKGGERQWNESREFLKGLVESKTVNISLCQKWPDKYGRLVSEVWVGEKNVSNEMVFAGFAKWWSTRRAAAKSRDTSPRADSHLDLSIGSVPENGSAR